MSLIAKSTDSNKKKELFAYTVRGEGEDEEEATISLLAYENHCREKDIHVMLEMR
jgi:hypothetical protein